MVSFDYIEIIENGYTKMVVFDDFEDGRY